MTTIKTIGLVIAGVIVSVLFSVAVVSKDNTLGAVYNTVAPTFPSLTVSNGNATTSTVLGKACLTMTRTDGTVVYWYANAAGNLSTTTSTGCVQ